MNLVYSSPKEMNLLPPPSESSNEYKTFLSQYKASARAIDTSASGTTFNQQMRQIIEKFPYFDHTTARVMAVAMHLAATATGPNTPFDREKARSLIDTAFASYRTKKDKSTLLIDTARYYHRILQS